MMAGGGYVDKDMSEPADAAGLDSCHGRQWVISGYFDNQAKEAVVSTFRLLHCSRNEVRAHAAVPWDRKTSLHYCNAMYYVREGVAIRAYG